MRQKSQLGSDAEAASSEWSIAAGRFTSEGEVELLRLFGTALQEHYRPIGEEPLPGDFRALLASLDEPMTKTDG